MKTDMKKKCKALEIRAAGSEKEFEEVVRNCSAIFGKPPELFISSNRYRPGFNLKNTRIGFIDGRQVASMNLQRRKVNLCRAKVAAGCVADVITHPEYRDLRIGSEMLDAAIAHMKQRGDAISILFASRHNYYGRRGWKVVPRPIYTVDSSREGFLVPARYSVKTVSLPEALKILELAYATPSAIYTGGAVRDREYWRSMPRWYATRNTTCIAAFEGDRPAAACILVQYHDCMRMYECANIRAHDESPKNLLEASLSLAIKRNLKCVRSVAPETHPVAVKTMLLGGTRETETDMMAMVLNYEALGRSIAPGLNKRLRAAGEKAFKNGVYKIVVDGRDEISFTINNGTLSCSAKRKTTGTLSVDSESFIRMLFGCSGFDRATARETLPEPFETLFKSPDFIFWDSDKF